MGYHSPCLDAFFLCPMLRVSPCLNLKVFWCHLWTWTRSRSLKCICSDLNLYCSWHSVFLKFYAASFLNFFVAEEVLSVCIEIVCQSIASFLKVYFHSLEEFFQVLQHIVLCNPGHNILAIFNNLAYIWITTSKTILDI